MADREPDKPNVEYDDPAKKPNAENMSGDRFTTAVLGRQGPAGFLMLVAAIFLFIIVGGGIFYFWT